MIGGRGEQRERDIECVWVGRPVEREEREKVQNGRVERLTDVGVLEFRKKAGCLH